MNAAKMTGKMTREYRSMAFAVRMLGFGPDGAFGLASSAAGTALGCEAALAPGWWFAGLEAEAGQLLPPPAPNSGPDGPGSEKRDADIRGSVSDSGFRGGLVISRSWKDNTIQENGSVDDVFAVVWKPRVAYSTES